MENKKNNRRKKDMRTSLVIAIACLLLLLVVLVVIAINITLDQMEPTAPTVPTAPTTPDPTVPSTGGSNIVPSDPITWPDSRPTTEPTTEPTTAPTTEPTEAPTTAPTTVPTTAPTTDPTQQPTVHVHDYQPSETVKATCQRTGYTIYACSCGDIYVADETPLGDHEYETLVVDPTTEDEGYTRYMCIHCDYEYRDNYTEKLPAPTTPPEEDVMLKTEQGLKILDIGSYSGPFLENGSGESVEDVLMIQVRNDSGRDIEFASIVLSGDGVTAEFTVSTLPAGATIYLLEQNAMVYTDAEFTQATADHVAFFAKPLSVHADLFKLQGLDGALNVQNISGSDISGTVEIYYKNYSGGQLYGGITYVARVTGGMTAGEIRQIMTGHFSVDESIIMFIRVVE